MRVAVPVDRDMGVNSPVAYRFARAPYFAIVDIDNGKISSISVVPNPNAMARGGAGPAAAQWLANQHVNVVLTPQVGPNAAAALNAMGIRILIASPGTPLIQALRSAGLVRE